MWLRAKGRSHTRNEEIAGSDFFGNGQNLINFSRLSPFPSYLYVTQNLKAIEVARPEDLGKNYATVWLNCVFFLNW